MKLSAYLAKHVVPCVLLCVSAMVPVTAQSGAVSPIQSQFHSVPHLLAEFAFDGSMTMYNPGGMPLQLAESESLPGEPTKHPVLGTMMLDFLTFGGTAEMVGPKPFVARNWTAAGPMSAHVDLLGALGLSNTPRCAGSLLCADASMNFKHGTDIPVMASFAMDPEISFKASWTPLDLRVGMKFHVSSIDTNGDGVPGTPISTVFENYTPSFEGVATISRIFFGGKIDNPGFVFDRPTLTTAVSPVPLPAAVWLLGSALLGLLGLAARHRVKH